MNPIIQFSLCIGVEQPFLSETYKTSPAVCNLHTTLTTVATCHAPCCCTRLRSGMMIAIVLRGLFGRPAHRSVKLCAQRGLPHVTCWCTHTEICPRVERRVHIKFNVISRSCQDMHHIAIVIGSECRFHKHYSTKRQYPITRSQSSAADTLRPLEEAMVLTKDSSILAESHHTLLVWQLLSQRPVHHKL